MHFFPIPLSFPQQEGGTLLLHSTVLRASCPAAKMGQGLGAPTTAFVLDKTRYYGEGCTVIA